jgi:hypothetical protein
MLGMKTGGRKKGSLNKKTELQRRLIEAVNADDKTIVDGIIRDAKNGDPEARRLYLRHLRPPLSRQNFVGPIDYVAPKTVEAAREAILPLGERLARNEISVEAHNALIDNVKAYLGDKAAEQQRILDDLEIALRGAA